MSRKLIKPNLNEIKKLGKKENKKKPPPPYKTHAENYYYIKQMNNKTPMVIELTNNDIIYGTIEWYDEKCLKIRKSESENLILFKHFIKYIYKNAEEMGEPPIVNTEKEAVSEE